ncbi:MAG: LysM peptidoglycan-binding domain-containing protein [Opitutales bacterium]
MPRFPSRFRCGLFLLCGAAVLLLAGCGDGGRLSYATEVDEPSYRAGQALLKSGRKQEALASFLKVIEKRGDDAPESHLEAGLLYYTHINDPLAAIYHFKQYLALRPNSPQAPLVRQRIDAAMREFARTLPAQPLENAGQRVDLIATLDRLKLENEMLKQQVADLKAGREIAETAEPAAGNGGTGTASTAANPADGESKFNFNLDAMPVVRTRPLRAQPEPARPSPANPASSPPAKHGGTVTRPAPTAAETAPAPQGRRHTVKAGDTLSKLSLQYYGSRGRWRDIFNANRKIMRNEGDLHVGMELVIP